MESKTKLKNIFLGPKAENSEIWDKYVNLIFSDYIHWRRNYFPSDKIVIEHGAINNSEWLDQLDYELNNTLNSLKAHFPFYSPRYMAHMLSEQTLPSVLGYFAGMLYNPNNVTDEAAPVTVEMEIEFGKKICQMLGYKSEKNVPTGWAHICSGGTLANLEALWVAREIQFVPLCVQEFCVKNNIRDFQIKTPSRSAVGSYTQANILDLKPRELLSLKPNEKIYMVTKLINYLTQHGKSSSDAIDKVNRHMRESSYSVRWAGFANVLAKVNLHPVVFVPESAHYSWDKAVSILGYGATSIRKIPLTSKFRIDTKKLEQQLMNLQENEYIAGIVAVVGTTEEGAVDPIHEVKFLRDKLENEKNMSFWLHVDAAWGGYIMSLFNDFNYGNLSASVNEEFKSAYAMRLQEMRNSFEKKNKQCSSLDERALECAVVMNITETFTYGEKKAVKFTWEDLDVIKSFMAIKDADSVTVDPHKMGYTPYPAGVIAFKNKNVVQYISQQASYISKSIDGIERAYVEEVTSVGPYIIEGSKPGAAAVSCWLSEKTIPLNRHNHGKIIKTTLLNAQKFSFYLKKLNNSNTGYLFDKKEMARPFKIIPLYDNIDTNIVCFVVQPMLWNNRSDSPSIILDNNLSLRKINEINEKVYRHFTINDIKTMPHSQKFFLSRTILKSNQYAYTSIKNCLGKLNINQQEYEQMGLFVLRATLMNPWYYDAAKEDRVGRHTDYFQEFFKELNQTVKSIINETGF